jgi:hypothetical protein
MRKISPCMASFLCLCVCSKVLGAWRTIGIDNGLGVSANRGVWRGLPWSRKTQRQAENSGDPGTTKPPPERTVDDPHFSFAVLGILFRDDRPLCFSGMSPLVVPATHKPPQPDTRAPARVNTADSRQKHTLSTPISSQPTSSIRQCLSANTSANSTNPLTRPT